VGLLRRSGPPTPLLFDKYDVSNVWQQRGPYAVNSEQLISDIYVNRQDANSYLSISAMDFQGLRQIAVGVTEDNRSFSARRTACRLFPVRTFPFAVFGGRLRMMASGVVLNPRGSTW